MQDAAANDATGRTGLLDAARSRAAGALLALALEALLIALFLWWLAPFQRERREVAMTTFDVSAPPAPADEVNEAAPAPAAEPTAQPPQPRPSPPDVSPPQPPAAVETPPPAIVPITPQQMAAADLRRIAPPSPPRPAAGPVYGPPAPPRAASSDSEIVGTAPNGQPLYAASWYREPYPEELRGYLSTASGPGWGLIACRTVREYRVDDCVGLEEYPRGSNIVRSVLAAAWQFKVRPPSIGGRSQYGEWVRIRIDYGIRRREPF